MSRFKAPDSGIAVRMYRQGHGDCFLLCTPDANGDPYYILIDCGLIRGSQIRGKAIEDIVQHIANATNKHIHLAVITHEHQDHVSGFRASKARPIFDEITIGKLWLPWTEDPDDELANELREQYKDTLLHLFVASRHLGTMAAAPAQRASERLMQQLEFDIDEEELEALNATSAEEVFSAKKIEGITNKRAMLYVKKKAEENDGIDFLRPHQPPVSLPNVDGIRVFVLGPPENEAKLRDLDPRGHEGFEFSQQQMAMYRNNETAVFSAAKDRFSNYELNDQEREEVEWQQPFAPYYRLHEETIDQSDFADFFNENYLQPKDGEGWRAIDHDWLGATENFAIRMSNYINNTSLVLAFELPVSKKVLLFVGDAQRGNWVSWHDKGWTEENGLAPGEEITTEGLLNRTVFYKVGHHGSHNATLSRGGVDMMAKGAYKDHFVAMIPANSDWALHKRHPWVHPLPAIAKVLREKSQGRVFLSSRQNLRKPAATPDEVWEEFKELSIEGNLYVEYIVLDQL